MTGEMEERDPPVVLFGKYHGSCAGCVAAADRQYVAWCLAQEWFPATWPELAEFWHALGIAPLLKCTATTAAGTPCTKWSQYGLTLCGTHYRQAEKAMTAAVEEIFVS